MITYDFDKRRMASLERLKGFIERAVSSRVSILHEEPIGHMESLENFMHVHLNDPLIGSVEVMWEKQRFYNYLVAVGEKLEKSDYVSDYRITVTLLGVADL